MKCIICGNSFLTDLATCPYCGAVLPASDEPVSPVYSAEADTIPYVPYTFPKEEDKNVFTPSDLELPAVQQKIQRQALSARMKTRFVILACLAIVEGCGIVSYGFIFRPAEFHIQATAITSVMLTAQAMSPQAMYAHVTGRKPAIDDSLTSPNHSLWDTSNNPKTGECIFKNAAYHVRVPYFDNVPEYKLFQSCLSSTNMSLNNFAFQVDITILSGDIGSLIFRANKTDPNDVTYYFFGITSSGFYVFGSNSIAGDTILNYAPSSAIKKGLDQQNQLAIIVQDTNYYLYINKQYVTMTSDSAYHAGNIGFAANTNNYTDFTAADIADIAFNNARVWELQ